MSGRLAVLIEESRLLLSSVPDAVCIKNTRGEIVFANRAYEKMLKRGSTELVSDTSEICENGVMLGTCMVYHDISDINRLRRELDRVKQKLRKAQTRYTFQDIIGQNKALLRVIETAKTASMTPATIMLRGESGTGKEIFANAIHNNSPRRNEKFVKINCASLPEALLESELFGYKEGAFTGALRGGRKGLFQEADRGTLFLDEIGDVSPAMQVKLLRALQEKEIMPVGASEAVKVDVRLICATNQPLEQMVEAGTFREDLYYRLNVFPLHIPPLRERKEDIGLIVQYLLQQYNEFYGRDVKEISQEAVALLQQEDWKGNVRELENVLSRVFVNIAQKTICIDRAAIAQAMSGEYGMLQQAEHTEKPTGAAQILLETLPENLQEAVAQTERQCIIRAIQQYQGDKNRAAVALGLPLRTLYYKCKKYGI